MTAVWLSLGMVALVFVGACHSSAPIVDVGSKPPNARGTIFGVVRGPEGTSPVSGRTVEVINIDSGERRTVQTGVNGGFTIALPAGKYRLELPLHAGETLTKRPGVVDLGHGEIESHIEFVLGVSGSVHVARPGGPAYRVDNGLGSPIA